MNAMEDNTLTRDQLMGFYMFLVSEKYRHANDISRIVDMLIELEDRLSLTDAELLMLRENAKKYVMFDTQKRSEKCQNKKQ